MWAGGVCPQLLFPNGREVKTPAPDRRLLAQAGVEFTEARGPSYRVQGLVLATGQILRSTDFEQGLPVHYAVTLASDSAS